ncbi:amidase (plasmid) [Streptococcus parasuis]|nr:amidase [Streptococcus parasuis]
MFLSRKTKQDLKKAKNAYKVAKSEFKRTKERYKASEKREARLLNPKTDAERRYVKHKQKARRDLAQEEIAVLKENKNRANDNKRKAIQRNGGTKIQKIRRIAHNQTRDLVESSFKDNEILEDIASTRQTIRKTHADIQRIKKIGHYTSQVGKNSVKGIYGSGNRTYNLLRGRGFTRTPFSKRWETKFKNKYQRMRDRIMSSRIGKTAKTTRVVTSKVSKPILTVMKNPLSAKAYLIMFLTVLSISLLGVISGGGSSTVTQDEFDLNDTWVYLTKLDRDKSNEKVDYWTNIDEILMFMGYKYEDFTLNDKYDGKDKKWYEVKHTYKDLLSDIWQELNGDKNKLKSMADIYTTSKNKYLRLKNSELKEFNEILKQSSQVGRYIGYNELASPFDKNTKEDSTIRIDKRFGYISKTKRYNGSILQANKGAKLYAVIDGKIVINGNDVTIKAQDCEFTYKNVRSKRVTNGKSIKVGSEIGEVSDTSGQEVYFKKIKNKKTNQWVWVNVGFYLPKCEYNQTTSVISDIDIDGGIGSKIISIYNYLKKKDSSITYNGVASMLGNFWTESSINPKRAEGDYLRPPIGATATSWDDPKWLSLNGPAIYNGKYPNILKRGLGLGQWTDTADGSTRHTALLSYAQRRGKKWYDLELQLDFMLEGDSPYYTRMLKTILRSNENINALTQKFLVYWEGNAGDKLKERQSNAQQVLNYLKNAGGTRGGSKTLQSSWNFPNEYRTKLTSYPSSATVTANLAGNTYPTGQCTWYVYNRLVEAGAPHYNWLGNGQDWVRNLVAKGWKYSNKPVPGAVMSIRGGFWGTDVRYGHVAYVEYVNPDGTFLISECNIKGVQNKIHWTVWTNQSYLSFAIPPK